jgi:hypothetical protein
MAAQLEGAVAPPSDKSGLTVNASDAGGAVPVPMMPAAIRAVAASKAIATGIDLRALPGIESLLFTLSCRVGVT